MKLKISHLILVFLLLTLFLTGFDFTHHAHNSWLYYQMIKSGDFFGKDPYFTSQITYAYGILAYVFTGLLWFAFGIHSITIAQVIIILISYYLASKMFKQDRWVSLLILLQFFFTVWDAYASHFSNCLFWIACYGFYKKRVWWPVPLILTAFNHPFILLASLFFTPKLPSLIIPQGLILSFFLVATRVFTTDLFLPVYTIFMGFVRIVLALLPLLILTAKDKLHTNEYKIVRDLVKVKATLPVILSIMILEGAVAVTLAVFVLVMQPANIVDFTMVEGIPLVNGTVRVIDYLYLPSVYVLPYQGFTLQAGSFRENNPQHMIQFYWSDEYEYNSFLENNNISYVLLCKLCNPQSNEKDMLDEYYSLIWENDYYYMYSVA